MAKPHATAARRKRGPSRRRMQMAVVMMVVGLWTLGVSGTRADEGCAMFGQNASGSPYANATAPQKLTDPDALKSLQSTCPELYQQFGGKEGSYCCDAAQVGALQTKLSLLHEIVVGCPACDHNFKHLWCYMTCAPNQKDFLTINKTKDGSILQPEIASRIPETFLRGGALEAEATSRMDAGNEGADSQSPSAAANGHPNASEEVAAGDVVLVDAVNFYVAPTFGSDLFDSCKDVKVSSMNAKAMDTLCMTSDCKGWHMMLSKQGGKIPLLNPINIIFPLNDSTSPIPQGLEPMNDTLPKCYDNIFGCSCGDCPAGPSCRKPEPPPPPSQPGCQALGFSPSSLVTCGDVGLAMAYLTIVLVTVFWMFASPSAPSGSASAAAHLVTSSKSSSSSNPFEESLLGDSGKASGLLASDDEEGQSLMEMHYASDGEGGEHSAHPLVLPPLERFLRKWFQRQGLWIAKHPWKTIVLTLVFVAVMTTGLLRFEVETDPERLWVPNESKSKAEKEHFDQAFGKFYRIEQLILSREEEGSDDNKVPFVNDDTVRLMFDMQAIVDNISVPLVGKQTNATLENICFKPFGPDGNCGTQSVLQYWQMDRQTFEDAAKKSSSDPFWMEFCFQHWMTEEECFSAFKAPMDPKLVFGGFPEDQGVHNYSEDSTSLIVVYLVDNSDENLDAALAFEKEFIRAAQGELSEMAARQKMRLSFSSESSVQSELERESNADAGTVLLSFAAMFAYMTVVLGGIRSFSPSLVCFRTRILLGLGGVVLVVLSVVCAAGILSAFGVKSTLLIVEVIPFLALAIGVDNMCIIAHKVNQSQVDDDRDGGQRVTHPDVSARRIAKALSLAGPSITLAASAEVLAFLAGVLTGMPACKTFALFAAVTILVDYIFQMTAFVALLQLDEQRIANSRMDCFPCVKDGRNHGMGSNAHQRGALDSLMATLSKTLKCRRVQGATIIVFVGLFVGAVAMIPHVDLGLEQTVALPQDSYLQNYFNDLASQLRVGPPVYFVVRDLDIHPTSPDVNKTCATAGCLPDSMLNRIQNAAEISSTSYIATAAASWLDDYIAWINPSLDKCCRMHPSNETFCSADPDGTCETCFDGNSDDPLFHLHGNRPTIAQLNKTLPWFMEAVPGKECAKAGAGAYNTELQKSGTDATGYKGIGEGIVAASRFRGYHTTLSTQKDYIDALEEAKKLTASISEDLGLDVYPYSVFYVFFEQYLHMQYYAVITFTAAAILILLVCYAFLGSLWASCFTMAIVMAIVVDVMGFMSLLDVQFNAVSLTNLAMSVGIALEFCIHIVRAFMVADGTRKERTAVALQQMGTPVFNGIALTKLIGVLVLSLSHTAIFQVYYFRMYLMLVVFSSLHAFIALPVLLMVAGPPRLPYATPVYVDELDNLGRDRKQ